jgi:hypothetical protein
MISTLSGDSELLDVIRWLGNVPDSSGRITGLAQAARERRTVRTNLSA